MKESLSESDRRWKTQGETEGKLRMTRRNSWTKIKKILMFFWMMVKLIKRIELIARSHEIYPFSDIVVRECDGASGVCSARIRRKLLQLMSISVRNMSYFLIKRNIKLFYIFFSLSVYHYASRWLHAGGPRAPEFWMSCKLNDDCQLWEVIETKELERLVLLFEYIFLLFAFKPAAPWCFFDFLFLQFPLEAATPNDESACWRKTPSAVDMRAAYR